MKEGTIKELIEFIALQLVDHPTDVKVNAIEGEKTVVLELRVHPDDLGKIIGRQGRSAQAMRTILNMAATKAGKRAVLEILE
jgi:predicted RNA-binding protein YlqC (UPF0109 family)